MNPPKGIKSVDLETPSDKNQVRQPAGFPGFPGQRQMAEVTLLFGDGTTVPFF